MKLQATNLFLIYADKVSLGNSFCRIIVGIYAYIKSLLSSYWRFSYQYSDLSSMPREFKNRWTVPGDEKRTNIPAIISKRQYEDNKDLMYAYNAYNYSTERIAKGDFIRMKEIS